MSSFTPEITYNFSLAGAAAAGSGSIGNGVTFPRDPSTIDVSGVSSGYQLGQQWWSTASNTLFILESLSGGVATWTAALTPSNMITSSTITTVGAVTSALFTVPLGTTPGTYTYEIDVAGYCFAGPQSPGSVGYTLVGAVRTTGAAAVLVPGQALDEFEEAGLAAADVDISVSGNNTVINVTGVVADSIRWVGTLKYIFQG